MFRSRFLELSNHTRRKNDLIQTITDWPTPKRIKDVQAFIGTTGFYRRFVVRYSHITQPLTDLTCGKKKLFH
jgi:hypothetical protein